MLIMRSSGFGLVELVAGLALVAVVTSAGALKLPDGSGQSAAERRRAAPVGGAAPGARPCARTRRPRRGAARRRARAVGDARRQRSGAWRATPCRPASASRVCLSAGASGSPPSAPPTTPPSRSTPAAPRAASSSTSAAAYGSSDAANTATTRTRIRPGGGAGRARRHRGRPGRSLGHAPPRRYATSAWHAIAAPPWRWPPTGSTPCVPGRVPTVATSPWSARRRSCARGRSPAVAATWRCCACR